MFYVTSLRERYSNDLNVTCLPMNTNWQYSGQEVKVKLSFYTPCWHMRGWRLGPLILNLRTRLRLSISFMSGQSTFGGSGRCPLTRMLERWAQGGFFLPLLGFELRLLFCPASIPGTVSTTTFFRQSTYNVNLVKDVDWICKLFCGIYLFLRHSVWR
jgi:hypothetical protein